MFHRIGMSIERLSTFFHWLFLLGVFTLPGKHDRRGWPSIWKKLLSGQRPGTGDCITPSYKERKSCFCLSLNKTVISSTGAREEAKNHGAPISSLQPGRWHLVVFNNWTLFQCIWENLAKFYCKVRVLFSKKNRRLQELVEDKNIQLFSGNTTWFHFKAPRSAIVYYLYSGFYATQLEFFYQKEMRFKLQFSLLEEKCFFVGRKNQGTAHSEISAHVSY